MSKHNQNTSNMSKYVKYVKIRQNIFKIHSNLCQNKNKKVQESPVVDIFYLKKKKKIVTFQT